MIGGKAVAGRGNPSPRVKNTGRVDEELGKAFESGS